MATRDDLRPSAPATEGRQTTPDGFHIRAAAFQPVRAAYVREILQERRGLDPAGVRALVVGSGRGLLARELARWGFAVTGLDPAAETVQLARHMTAAEGLAVDYDVGAATALPYADETFDVVYYADTFETIPDLEAVLAEAARVLRRHGALVYDTVTRTRLSRLIYLRAFQSWRWTRIMPPGRYAADRLRPPDELAAAMAAHGLRGEDVRGFQPASPPRLIRATLRARRGDIDDAELAELAGMRLAAASKRPEVTYLGLAIKHHGRR